MKSFNTEQMEAGVVLLLQGMGIDLEDPNFEETPARVARSFSEICGGLNDAPALIEKALSKSFPTKYDGIIFCPDVAVYSMCPHHLLPVEYLISIGYIPAKGGEAIGASKLARIAEALSKRPVLQEDLCLDIVEALKVIKPQGVAIVMSGLHGCMRVRGIKQRTSFETSYMTGSFKENTETREEFFHLLSIAQRNKR